LRVFPALAEEGDDAVGELPRGTASRGAASSQSMMSAPWPPMRSRRSRVAPSAAGRRDAHGARRGAFLCRMLEIQNGLPEIY
jgi:hypothetical protein